MTTVSRVVFLTVLFIGSASAVMNLPESDRSPSRPSEELWQDALVPDRRPVVGVIPQDTAALW